MRPESEPIQRRKGAQNRTVLAYGEHIRTASLAVIAIILLFGALKAGSAFWIPVSLAALATLILTPAAEVLERFRVPRGAAALMLVAAGMGGTAGSLYWLIPTAEVWRDRAPEIARDLERFLRSISEDVSQTPGLKEAVGDGDAADLVGSGQDFLADFALSAPQAVAGLLIGTFLTFFMLAEREQLWRLAVSMGPNMRRRLTVARTIRQTRADIGTYLFSITAINICLGIVTTGVLYYFGIPNPAIWGAAMTMLNYMPYLGPMIMNVVIFAIGLATFPELQQAVWPVVAIAGLNLLEGNLITPRVVGQTARVGTMAVFLVVVFGYWLWGPTGALIATPTLIVGRAIARGLFMDRQRRRSREAVSLEAA